MDSGLCRPVILRSVATRNLALATLGRESPLPLVAQNDESDPESAKCDSPACHCTALSLSG
jgi:hypothetical protein